MGGCTCKITIVLEFDNTKRWKRYFKNIRKTNKLMVIDFSASQSTPCQQMGPIFNELAMKNRDIEFIRLDVDKLNDVAREFGIEETPTFMLMRSGEEVDKLVGASRDELEKLINKHRG